MELDLDVMVAAKAQIDYEILPNLESYRSALTGDIEIIAQNIEGYDLTEVINIFDRNTEGVVGHIEDGMTQISNYLATKINEMQGIMETASTGVSEDLDLLNSISME